MLKYILIILVNINYILSQNVTLINNFYKYENKHIYYLDKYSNTCLSVFTCLKHIDCKERIIDFEKVYISDNELICNGYLCDCRINGSINIIDKFSTYIISLDNIYYKIYNGSISTTTTTTSIRRNTKKSTPTYDLSQVSLSRDGEFYVDKFLYYIKDNLCIDIFKCVDDNKCIIRNNIIDEIKIYLSSYKLTCNESICDCGFIQKDNIVSIYPCFTIQSKNVIIGDLCDMLSNPMNREIITTKYPKTTLEKMNFIFVPEKKIEYPKLFLYEDGHSEVEDKVELNYGVTLNFTDGSYSKFDNFYYCLFTYGEEGYCIDVYKCLDRDRKCFDFYNNLLDFEKHTVHFSSSICNDISCKTDYSVTELSSFNEFNSCIFTFTDGTEIDACKNVSSDETIKKSKPEIGHFRSTINRTNDEYEIGHSIDVVVKQYIIITAIICIFTFFILFISSVLVLKFCLNRKYLLMPNNYDNS
jgi:hypothetical protein